MIQVHKDALGNTSGYWDTEQNCWRSPAEVATVHILESGQEPQAADSDDAQEPEVEPVPGEAAFDWDSLTKDQIKEWLKTNGHQHFGSSLTKAELIALAKSMLG